MSKDRIRFFLPRRYFEGFNSTNGMKRETCLLILNQAFGLACDESEHLMDKYPDGFVIVCRPSQFARFIFYRCQADECINGIKDLRLELIGALDKYDRVVRATGVCREIVQKVLWAAGMDSDSEIKGSPSIVYVDNRTAGSS